MCDLKLQYIKFGDRVIKLRDKEHTILYDANHVELVKVTTEIYDLLEKMAKEHIGISEVVSWCETEEDRDYFLKVCSYLLNKKIIRDEMDNSEYIDLDMQIDLSLTNVCNLRCRHCCVSAGICSDELNTEQMLQIIRKIVSVHPRSITISGGEPLMRSDFCYLIEQLRESFTGRLGLMTNAILVTPELATFINKHFDSVSISLDGVDEETCAPIRGIGTFHQTMKGICLLQEAGVKKISLSMVLTTYTFDKQQQFKELCERLHAEPCIRGLSLVGRAEQEMRNFVLDPHEMPINDSIQDYFEENKDRLHTLFNCGAAYRQFQIGYRGEIYPCQSMMDDQLILGNVLEVADLNIFIRKREFTNTKAYKTLERYFPYNYGKCAECSKNIFCFNCVDDLYRNKDPKPFNAMCQVPFEQVMKKMVII